MTIEIYTPDNLPPVEVIDNTDGTGKTVIQFSINEDGDVIKETNEYKIERRLVSSEVARRKHWKKYGLASNDPPGGNSANTYPTESISMQMVQATRQVEQAQERPEEEVAKVKTVCRYCEGAHFSHKCPNKSDMEEMQALREKLRGKDEPLTEETVKEALVPEPIGHSKRYIPPALRGPGAAAAVASAMGTDKRSSDGHTVRVTNLPSDTTAEDLKQLFSPFGHVNRFHLAKDKITQQNRGFAFISYATAEEATAAIYAVNGLRHNHVVLKVDWAKPSNT